MSSIAGRALVADFDGTLTALAVDWTALRQRLGVRRIGELWSRGPYAFDPVTRAEVAAAREGPDAAIAVDFALAYPAVAVLTDNAEAAVQVFLERQPELQRRCALVAGRETLAGSKRDPAVFARGALACLGALGCAASDCAYLGDQVSELALAHALGFHVVDVASLGQSTRR